MVSLTANSDHDLGDDIGPQRRLGFQLYSNKLVRPVARGAYAVKLESGACYVIENKDGHWVCDCGKTEEKCPHIYAAQLLRLASINSGEPPEDPLRCRYCGSPDIRGCGFRYGARGIAHRYLCNECRRKFSVKQIRATDASKAPSELLFYLNEIALIMSKLNDLLERINKSLLGVT
jgi:hypothetical protein